MGEQPAEALFACTKCHARHAFEDLSHDDMLCKSCHESVVTVKCNYCREEFHLPSGKASGSVICKKCQNNVKLYGKPSACEYCSIVAAFIGSRCQRCTNSERRWGVPVSCDQCRQRCAFRRPDDSRRKVDGRTLCWLCTLAYKRVKARARKRTHQASRSGSAGGSEGGGADRGGEGTASAAMAVATQAHARRRSHGTDGGEREPPAPSKAAPMSMARQPEDHTGHKRRRTEDHSSATAAAAHPPTPTARHGSGPAAAAAAATAASNRSPAHSPEKKPKIERSASNSASAAGTSSMVSASKGSNSASNLGGDATLSENMITITRLHEEVEALKKLLLQKEQQVLERDRKLTEVKARNYEIETELRNKISSLQKSHSETISNLQAKNKDLMKQVATLSKSMKKTPGLTAAAASATSSPAR